MEERNRSTPNQKLYQFELDYPNHSAPKVQWELELGCPRRACVAEFSPLRPRLWWRWEGGALGGCQLGVQQQHWHLRASGASLPQHVDMNSSRNLFVFGFSIFCGLAIPNWVNKNSDRLQTGDSPAWGL